MVPGRGLEGAPTATGTAGTESLKGLLAAVAAALFDVPATSVPVAAKIGLLLGNDDQVSLADLDGAITSGADVALTGGVRLHRSDDFYPERAAHATRATAMRSVPITKAKSSAVFRCERKGLKPMAGMVGGASSESSVFSP